MRSLATIFRHMAAFALLLQIALPYAQAQAAANGVDLAHLICNPSGQTISTEAQVALDELLDVLEPSDDSSSMEDCDRCVMPHAAIPAVSQGPADKLRFIRAPHSPKPTSRLTDLSPRGPPCGRRAPPSFL